MYVDPSGYSEQCGTGSESGSSSVQHAVGSANQAQSVLDGINYVIYNDFENILSPRNVTPVD
ncbi:MAG: hypothetical protein K5895_03745 [Lachnospiraceae bacterium]|nr:hypothetical protein [Lachnospiraceae bacterium]